MKKIAALLGMSLAVISMACSPVRKVPDSILLNSSWELQQIGDTVISNGNQARGVPTLVFDLKENRASGFSGCNRFSGRFTIERDGISFGPLAATKMACLGSNVEDRYLRALSIEKLAYRISDQRLYLGEGKARLVFKKAD